MNYCPYCMEKTIEGAVWCQKCGKPLKYESPVHHLLPGTILNKKFVVGAALGEGGFGITYLGRDLNLDIKVAIKEYFPYGFANRNNTLSAGVTEPVSEDKKEFYDKGRKSFLREARSLAKFKGEPGVVDVQDFFEENNTAYIVMEYLEGETLKQYLQKNGPLSCETTLEMLLPVMKSLEKVHDAGLIHRDISPDNIMIVGDRVKLLDFGAARDSSPDANKSLSILLKPGYAPEEQYRSRGKQGPWTDVYALCATMYKCVTGVTPEESIDRAVQDDVRRPSELGVSIDPKMERVIMKGMAVFAANRYQSIGELLADLSQDNPRPSDVRTVGVAKNKDARTIPATHSSDVTATRYNGGAQRPSPAPASPQPQTAKADTGTQKKKQNTAVVIVSVVTAVALLLAVTSGILFFSKGKNDPENNGGTSAVTATPEGNDINGDKQPAPGGEAGGTFRIGFIGPLTGGTAIFGNAAKNGAQIAVDEINAKGGVQIEYNPQDDAHDAELSVNAYNTLVDWGMQALVGPVTTTPAIAVAAEANNDRMFCLTPSAGSVDVIDNNDVMYQVCFTDPNQGAGSADYIAENYAGKTVAVIYRNDDTYSQGIRDTFVAEAQAKGVEVVYEGSFTEATSSDFTLQVTGAQAAGAEIVFLPIYYQPASVILKQAHDIGYAPIFFGVDGMDGILTMDGFDASLAEGVMLLTPFSADDPDAADFVAAYQAAYGEIPNQFAADGYDAVYIIYNALLVAGCTEDMSAEEIYDALTAQMASMSYDGLTGKAMTWDDNGAVHKLPLTVVIRNGEYVTP